MHPIKTFLTKRKIKQVEKEIKQVEKDLKNVYICMTDWSHGEMGYTQTPEELTELEKEETRLKEKKNKTLQRFDFVECSRQTECKKSKNER